MNAQEEASSRYSISQSLVVICILSALFAFLLPAVNSARKRQSLPPLLPVFEQFYNPHIGWFLIGFPLVVTAVAAIGLIVVRQLLPDRIRSRFPWKPPRTEPPAPPPPIHDSRPALAIFFIGLLATALLIVALCHVRADRTNRTPVVTWEGPLAAYVVRMAYTGWTLSLLNIPGGAYTLYRYCSRYNSLAAVGVMLGYVNLMGGGFIVAVIYED